MNRREFLATAAAASLIRPGRAAAETNPARIVLEIVRRTRLPVDVESFEKAADILDQPVIPNQSTSRWDGIIW